MSRSVVILCLLLVVTSLALAESSSSESLAPDAVKTTTDGPDPIGQNIVDDPEPIGVEEGRFDSTEITLLLKYARKANAVYPQVGGVIHVFERQPNSHIMVLGPFQPLIFTPLGACDSNEECHDAADAGCAEAGHQGGDESTTEVITAESGSKICSEDCSDTSGAVYTQICRTSTIIDETEPVGIGRGMQDVAPNP